MTFLVPEKPTLEGIEAKWSKKWEENRTYTFNSSDELRPIYSIDTPPPTVSGSLHAGHVLSYTHTDIIARYKRMAGFNVFYPMGWDDNGLPTERRVQNYFGITCDPSIAYDPAFTPRQPTDPKARYQAISRANFVESCQVLTLEDELAFERLWRALGLSVDWTRTYTTIGENARRISQLSFLRLFKQGKLYLAESPTLWDVDFQSAVSQAELEDKDEEGTFYSVRFTHKQTSEPIEIQTTRPELLASCVALVANPNDLRYQAIFNSTAITPLFNIEVPILAHPLAEMEKGSGIAMVCTFGDLTDVTWWKELSLELRPTIGRNGRMLPVDFESERFQSNDPVEAQSNYEAVTGKTTRQARLLIGELLESKGLFSAAPRKIQHSVKYYEKGDKPLEVVTSWQWYIKTMEYRERLIELGNQLHWNPTHMKVRYENWINGLTSDWNISRQRYFGIPIPVWYRIDEAGNIDRTAPIFPDEEHLPIDPFQDTPSGFNNDQRDQPGGFMGDPDVMDTWATSSLTPQIACGWESDGKLFSRLFPMDLRPQAHDIIRTWLFYTVLRSEISEGVLPWKNTVISGFVLDPDRKKMSKSKGNVVTPMPLLELHGADAIRYWAANGRPGVDTAIDENTMKMGRRLAIKILNASKFAISIATGPLPPKIAGDDLVICALDQGLLDHLTVVINQATKALDQYDYARALENIESFFWSFCDNYIELVKLRGYGTDEGDRAFSYREVLSARVTLLSAIEVIMSMLAPYLPYATEEVWSWFQPESVHNAPWPNSTAIQDLTSSWSKKLSDSATEVKQNDQSLDLGIVYQILSRVRRVKTEAKVSMKAPVSELIIKADSATVAQVELARDDLIRATQTISFKTTEVLDLEQLELDITL